MIAIVDYGMGNLRSVQKGFARVGHEAEITADPDRVANARGIVLPGVGAFGDAMINLGDAGLTSPIVKAVSEGVPFLGICLGLQLLFTESEELGVHRGLDLLAGKVCLFPEGQRVPQIGWNQIHIQRETPLLAGVPDGAFFYFVHSYYVSPSRKEDGIASTDYGIDYVAIAGAVFVFGVQVLPEKSQDAGVMILSNFGNLAG